MQVIRPSLGSSASNFASGLRPTLTVRRQKQHGNDTAWQSAAADASALTLPNPSQWRLPFSEIDKEVVNNTLACAGAALADPLMSLVCFPSTPADVSCKRSIRLALSVVRSFDFFASVIVSQLFMIALQKVDTAFVGQLGVLPLAALGPNAALFNVVFFVGFSAIGVMATDLVAEGHGTNNATTTGRGLIISSIVSLVLGVAIAALLLVAPEQSLQLFQTNAEMMPYAREYCIIRAFGVPAALLMVVFQAAFRGIEDMRTPLLIVVAAGLVNAVLDPILMFTFNMGIAGAAYATSASQIAGMAMFMWLIHRRRHQFGLPQVWRDVRSRLLGDGQPPSNEEAPPLPTSVSPLATQALATASMSVRAPPSESPSVMDTAVQLWNELPWATFMPTCIKLAMRCTLMLSTWTLCSAVATNMGTYTIAAYQIMQQLLQLQLSVCWSFLAVGQSMVGVAMARAAALASADEAAPSGDGAAKVVSDAARAKGRAVGGRVIAWAVFASCSMAAATWALRGALPRLFTDNATVLGMVEGSSALMCLMLAISWNNSIEGVLMGANDTQFVINVYPWSVGGFMVVLGASVLAGWGLPGIWLSLIAYYVGLVIFLGARYWLPKFRKNI